MLFSNNGAKRVSQHLLFWVLFYIYDGPITSTIEADPGVHLQTAAIALPIKIIATYFTLALLKRISAEKNKYGTIVAYLALSIFFFGLAQRTVSYTFIYPRFYPKGLERPLLYAPKVIIETFGVYSVVAIVATLHFIKSWYIAQQEKQSLSNEKLNAELKFLKAQIHPHFLFNTLNNLYTLTLTDPEKAPKVVYKLSQIMSYMLYDSNKAHVPLQMEVDHIENYIALEKIRYDERLDVALDILSPIDTIAIAPLIIIPFVENSFKHGFSNEVGKVWVHISILTNNNELIIKIENSRGRYEGAGSEDHKGVGLTNVKKRLELIYKENYQLQIVDEETFMVILKIKLAALFIMHIPKNEMSYSR